MKRLVVGFVVCVCAIASDRAALRGQFAAAHTPAASAAVVARVNGVPISMERLNAALRNLLPMESYHRSVSDAKIDQLRRTALDSLIDEELRYQDGAKSPYRPSGKEVDAGLARAVAAYKSPADFERARKQSGATMDAIRAEIKRALVIQKAWEHAVVSRCQVSPREAEQYFTDNRARFVVPEQLRVSVLTVGVDPSAPARQWAASRATAEDVLGRLRAGSAFDELARKHSTDKYRDRGGDMGFVHRGSLATEIEAAVKDLKPGQSSGIVQTLYGFHIVKVDAIKPPEQKTFGDVGAVITKDLTARRCAEMTTAWTNGLRSSAVVVRTSVQAARPVTVANGGRR